MTIKLTPVTIGIAILAFVASWVIYGAFSKSSRAERRDDSCEMSCQTLKHKMIEGQCHCMTTVGWVKAGKAGWVEKKVRRK
jgi:hypothetical protein